MIREPIPAFEQEQGDDYIAKLDKFIEQVAEAYRNESIPVANDGRINENISNRGHAESYFDIKKGAEETPEPEVAQFENIAAARKPEKRKPSEDEQLAMLS